MFRFRSDFVSDAVVRMVRTFAQTLTAALGGSALHFWDAGWMASLGLAGSAAFISLLQTLDRMTVTTQGEIIIEDDVPADTATVELVESSVGCGENLR